MLQSTSRTLLTILVATAERNALDAEFKHTSIVSALLPAVKGCVDKAKEGRAADLFFMS